MVAKNINDALDEISFLKRECLSLLDSALAAVTPSADGDYPDSFRNLVTPFAYSVWERCFTNSFGVMLRLIRTQSSQHSKLSMPLSALWLQREPFFVSFIAKMRTHPPTDDQPTRKMVKGSSYNALIQLLIDFENWRASDMSAAIDPNDLIMTFSNVNATVLDVNALAIGLDVFPEYISFRKNIGRLDDLVGRRNDIGHGTLSRPPGNLEFKELIELTRSHLITEFCEVVQTWIAFR